MRQGNKRFMLVQELMRQYRFATIRETREVLVYDTTKGIYVPGGEAVIESAVQSELKHEASLYEVNEILGHIKRSTLVPLEMIDMSEHVINVRNGLLNAMTGKLVPHTPDYISITQLPVVYDPLARCPAVERYLEDVFDKDDAKVVKEFIGFLLVKRYVFHKALIVVGETGTGKTTLLRLLAAFLGERNVSTRTLQELCEDRFAPADLFGKLANISDDIPASVIRYSGRFKQLTGESRITGQRKFKDSFDFVNQAKLIFACNELPPVSNMDEAYYYRWLIVRTRNSFRGEKANRNQINELTTQEELSGLLNLALSHRRGLLENNDFSYDSSIEHAARRYMLTVKDSVAKFVAHCIERDGDSTIEKQKLFEAYVEFCMDYDLPVKSDRGFFRRLSQLLGESIDTVRPSDNERRPRYFKGIKLKR